ncbi:hypothetical protein MHH_c05850 [Mannheimia haemolytica M42548]|nr:hypothetical protein MHH_c05850 [Mannheimia haemolytica M42548]
MRIFFNKTKKRTLGFAFAFYKRSYFAKNLLFLTACKTKPHFRGVF